MSQKNSQINQTAALAGLTSQVGCVTGLVAVLIIAVAFAAGQFLDNYFDLNGLFTVLFMVGSFPVTLFAMVRISLSMVARTQKRLDELNQELSEKEKSGNIDD